MTPGDLHGSRVPAQSRVSDPISESEGKDVREWIELRTVEVDEKEREDGKFPL